MLPGAPAQVLQRIPAAQVAGDLVIHQRISRGHCIRVAHHLLHSLRGQAAFPQADQPQAGNAALLQNFQLFIRDLVEVGDGALVFFGQLVEPDIGVLGDQHEARHPVLILAEAFVFGIVVPAKGQHGRIAAEPARTRAPDDLFPDKVNAAQDPDDKTFTQDRSPAFEQVFQLGLERVGGAPGRGEQRIEESLAAGSETRFCHEKGLQAGYDCFVGGCPAQFFIIEQLVIGGQGGIGVGQVEQQHFLQRGLAVRPAGCFQIQVMPGIDLAAMDGQGGKFFREFQQGCIGVFPDIFKCPLHCAGILPFILADEDMQNLVDQSHGIDIAGRDRFAAHPGHALGKMPGGGKICQDHIAIQGEKGLIKLVFPAGFA